MSYSATTETLSTTSKNIVYPNQLVKDLADARDSFNPNNYQDAWAAGEGFRELTHEYRHQQ